MSKRPNRGTVTCVECSGGGLLGERPSGGGGSRKCARTGWDFSQWLFAEVLLVDVVECDTSLVAHGARRRS